MNGAWRLEGFLEAIDQWIAEDTPEQNQRVAMLEWTLALMSNPYENAIPNPDVGLPWWFARVQAASTDTHVTVCSYRVFVDERLAVCSHVTSLRRPV